MSQKLKTRLCNTAKTWIGVPYEHRGTTRNGCDCSGLLIGVMRELGYLKDFVYPSYPRDWCLHSFVRKHNYITKYIRKYANQVAISGKQLGDILLFRYAKVICHTGIYVGKDLFIHSYLFRPVSYGTLKNSPYSNRLMEVWRIDEGKLNV